MGSSHPKVLTGFSLITTTYLTCSLIISRRPFAPALGLELVVPGVDRERSVVVRFVLFVRSLLLFVAFLLFACLV